MSEDDKIFYIAFRKSEDGTITGLKTHRDLNEVAKFRDEEVKIDGEQLSENNTENFHHDIKDSDYVFRKAMSSCYERLSPYHNVIELTSFFRSGLQAANISNNILALVEKRGENVESTEELDVFSVPSIYFDKIQSHVENMKEVDAGMDALPSSILLSLVATYDSIISEFALDMLRLHPEQIEDSSNKTLTYREIFEIGNIDEVREQLFDSEIDKFLRGSHLDQAVYLEKLIDTKIIDKYSRWPNYYEIFERRNRYAHASGVANAEYIRKLDRQKYPIDSIVLGQVLRLKTSYLHKSVDYLTEFGILLAFMAWRKFGISANEAYKSLSDQAYYLISKKRYTLATWLLDFALNKQSIKGVDDIVVRMMTVNLANAYKKKKDIDKFEKTLNSLDWSATSLDFSICIAALREDTEKVCEYMDAISSSKMIQKSSFRTWPVFDWVKEKDEFRSKFAEVYGEEFTHADLDDEHKSHQVDEALEGTLH